MRISDWSSDVCSSDLLKVTVKTASVFTGHKKRDDHLRSADFLNSKEFPEMTFVGESTEKTGPRTGKIHGELTLLGVTRPVTLDVVLNRIGEYPIGDRKSTRLNSSH